MEMSVHSLLRYACSISIELPARIFVAGWKCSYLICSKHDKTEQLKADLVHDLRVVISRSFSLSKSGN